MVFGLAESYPIRMSEPLPNIAERELSPVSVAVLGALRDSLRRGDAAAIATWQDVAANLGLSPSVRGVSPDPAS